MLSDDDSGVCFELIKEMAVAQAKEAMSRHGVTMRNPTRRARQYTCLSYTPPTQLEYKVLLGRVLSEVKHTISVDLRDDIKDALDRDRRHSLYAAGAIGKAAAKNILQALHDRGHIEDPFPPDDPDV